MGEKKQNIKPEDLRCPKCDKPLSTKEHQCNKIPPGVYNGNGGDLGDDIVKEYYNNDFSNNAFYIPMKDKPRNGIEAHHLLSSSSVRYIEEYCGLIMMLGYNINHRKNGVLLPNYMKIACAFGVPLHKGGHGTTFIKNPGITDDDKKNIVTWKFKANESQPMSVIFPTYDIINESVLLTYEANIKKIVKGICEQYMEDDICDVDERFNKAKSFINDMDKHSQIVFQRLATFSWILTSDGFDYSPGNIGCCNCSEVKAKRVKIKNSLIDEVSLPSADEAPQTFWSAILESQDMIDKIKQKDFICIAGRRPKDHHDNYGKPYYNERKNIEDFTKFKNK